MLSTFKIPKKIHFIFLSKTEKMPDFFEHCFGVAKELHPDWEINLYDEDDATQLIKNHFPELKDLYNSYAFDVQRADILRVLLVYLYGGFYMDLDVYCLKNLDPLLKFNLVLGEEKRLSREVCTALGLKNPNRIANYMFGSMPKHPFWSDFLNDLMEKSLIEIKNENDVLESTGPGLLTDFYHSKADRYRDIILLLNKDRVCLNELHKEVACHFGNYAAHLHTGTWRWQGGETPKFNKTVHKSNSPGQFISPFRYKVDDNNYSRFYFYQELAGNEIVCNKGLAELFKINGTYINTLSEINNEKTVLFGPISNFINTLLTENTYVYCNSSPQISFTIKEVDFINNNFSSCIVPADWLKKIYEQNGVVINIQVIEPGFKRHKRDFEGSCNIGKFKLGCFASSLDIEILKKLLQACKNLQKEQIPSLKIKLYDPNGKFQDFYSEFTLSGVVEYTSIIVGDEFFSSWFDDVRAGFFGFSHEPWPSQVLEFLYLGIPIIAPNTLNYQCVLEGITAKPAVVFCASNQSFGLLDQDTTIEEIERAIMDLYQDYEYYNTQAIDASEEIEDLYTLEETKQLIINFLTKSNLN